MNKLLTKDQKIRIPSISEARMVPDLLVNMLATHASQGRKIVCIYLGRDTWADLVKHMPHTWLLRLTVLSDACAHPWRKTFDGIPILEVATLDWMDVGISTDPVE